MKRFSPVLFGSVLALVASVAAYGQPKIELNDPLPRDPAVRVGKLSNGITYYVRKNAKPEGRAELRLAIKAGSVLEDDDQLGLAHFVEHMAFNGTKNFEKNALVGYLESIGMRFGADLNAYTSFDETVYMLQVPTDEDDLEALKQGLLILDDWAHTITFDAEQIDAERGVIVEEWRLRRGGDARVGEEQFKAIFHGSKYADRSPIGTKEILETFPHDRLVQFYRDWYRPDMMAIVAVGDFDPDDVEEMIKEEFSEIPAAKKPRTRPTFEFTPHAGTMYSLAFDKEATSPEFTVIVRHPAQKSEKVADYRRDIIYNLIGSMMNQRFSELSQQADPPFLGAGGGVSRSVGGVAMFNVGGRVRDGEYMRGLEAALTEVERIKRYGFTASELDREKKSLLRGLEQIAGEADKLPSGNFAREYVGNFTTGEPFPGIQTEFAIHNKYVPGITLEEINAAVRGLIVDQNRVILVGGPPTGAPTESQLKELVAKVEKGAVESYSEEVVAGELLQSMPTPGTVVKETKHDKIGVVEWKLSNGVRVLLKPTDFKNDEILMTAYSPGGTSLAKNENFIAASTASDIINASGVGEFDRIALQKYLSDKVVGVSPGIGDLYETVSGTSSKADLETMFQMTYLYFTDPRFDTTAMATYRSQIAGVLETKGASPESVFSDTVSYVSAGYHFRARPWTTGTLDEMSLQRSYDFYRDRFGDAGDFTFVFVGSFTPEEIKPLVATYLGGLPSSGRKETWNDVGMKTPRGVVERTIRKGIEPKGQVLTSYTGDFDWSMENRFLMQALVEVLNMKLRETLREEKGGVYSPGAWGDYEHFPESEYSVNVVFGCDPDRAQELIGDVREIVASLKSDLVDQSYIDKVKEIRRRERETQIRQNGFWANSLQFYLEHGEDMNNILRYSELGETLTREKIREAANRYFDEKNRMTFVLLPETEN